MLFNKNTVLAILLTAAASMGGTVVAGADTDHWTSTRLARKRKVDKANSGGGGGTNASTPAAAPIRDLFVQPGIGCHITKHGSGYFLSATVETETTYFSERPKRTAGTIATHEFVDRFAYIFATSNPNAAVTFTGNKDSTMTAAADNNRPLIVELSPPLMYYTMMDSSIIYPITQSKSQGEVVPMDQFLEMSDVSCSIFVDNGDVSSTVCPSRTGPYECAGRWHCLPCFTLDLPQFQTNNTNCTNELAAIAGTPLMNYDDSHDPCPTPPPTLPPLPIPKKCKPYNSGASGATVREVGCRLPKTSCPPTGRADNSQCTPGCKDECDNSCLVTGSNTRYMTSLYYDKDGGTYPFDVGICKNGNHESVINKLVDNGDLVLAGGG